MRQMREDKPDRADCDTQQQADPDETGRARSGGRRSDLGSPVVRSGGGRQSDLGPVLARAGLLSIPEILRLVRHRFLGEIIVFSIHAIDLAWSAVPQTHRPTPRRAKQATQATGSKDGERSRSRPLTRGWEAPVDRLGNRSPASQGTRLCGGRGVFTGVSLSPDPTGSPKRDTEMQKISPTEHDRSRCALRVDPQAGCERAGRPCDTSPPTSHARDRIPHTRDRPQADF